MSLGSFFFCISIVHNQAEARVPEGCTDSFIMTGRGLKGEVRPPAVFSCEL